MRCRAKAEVICRHCERNFQVFPFVLIVCLEEKSENRQHRYLHRVIQAGCSRFKLLLLLLFFQEAG